MPNQNLNQFTQTSIRGVQDLSVGGAQGPVVSGRVSANENGAPKPGDFVKLDNAITVPGLPSYLLAGVSDVAHGVVLFEPSKSTYAKGDVMSIGLPGVVYSAVADVIVAPGAKVESVANGNLQTKSANSTRGVAVDYGAAGALFRVLFKPEAL